jgi:hypothetical protein
MSHKRSKKSKYWRKRKEDFERFLMRLELKNIPKIFDHKEKEVIALDKGYFIDIEEGEVLYSPKHISPILKKLF